MNVFCPHCRNVYRVDPERVPVTGVRVRCTACAGIFPLRRREGAEEADAARRHAAAIANGAGDDASFPEQTAAPADGGDVAVAAPPPDPGDVSADPVAGPSHGEAPAAPAGAGAGAPEVAAGAEGGDPAMIPTPPAGDADVGATPEAENVAVTATADAAAPAEVSLDADAGALAATATIGTAIAVAAAATDPPVIDRPAVDPPADDLPADDLPADGPSADRPPADGLSADGPPADGSAADAHPADGPVAARAMDPPASDSPAAGPPASPARGAVFGAVDADTRARRLARALISDIVAYHARRRDEALAAGRLRTEFREEILKCWEEYVAQVGEELALRTPHFRDALNEILARGEKVF